MMKHEPFLLTFAALAFGFACPISDAFAAAQPIFWNALRPADQPKATVPLSGKAVSGPQGETLAWHGEEHPIELTGFVLPVDQDGDLVYEFSWCLGPEPAVTCRPLRLTNWFVSFRKSLCTWQECTRPSP